MWLFAGWRESLSDRAGFKARPSRPRSPVAWSGGLRGGICRKHAFCAVVHCLGTYFCLAARLHCTCIVQACTGLGTLPPSSSTMCRRMLGNFGTQFLASRQAALSTWLQAVVCSPGQEAFNVPEFVAFITDHANTLPGPVTGKALNLPASAQDGAASESEDSGRSKDSGSPQETDAASSPPSAPALTSLGSSSTMGGHRSSSSITGSKVRVEDFKLLKVIGKGSFGKVLLVRQIQTGKVMAMKVLSKANIVKRRQVEHTRTERKVLSYTRHPFIVTLHYAFQTKDQLYFVLDYCGGGELFLCVSSAAVYHPCRLCTRARPPACLPLQPLGQGRQVQGECSKVLLCRASAGAGPLAPQEGRVP